MLSGGYPPLFWELPAEDAAEVLLRGHERLAEEKLFFRWAIHYQHQISFDEFRRTIIPPPSKSADETLEDVNSIIELFNKSGLKSVDVEF